MGRALKMSVITVLSLAVRGAAVVRRETAVRSSVRAAAEMSQVCSCADLMRDEEAEV